MLDLIAVTVYGVYSNENTFRIKYLPIAKQFRFVDSPKNVVTLFNQLEIYFIV